jgi:hypothetical protein
MTNLLDVFQQEKALNLARVARFARTAEIAMASMLVDPRDRDRAVAGIMRVADAGHTRILARGGRFAFSFSHHDRPTRCVTSVEFADDPGSLQPWSC